MTIIKDKWNEPFIGPGYVSKTSFADDVRSSREEARRHSLDVTMLKEHFELSDTQVQELNSFISEMSTYYFRDLLLRYLGKEKIPVISLDKFTQEFMQTLQLKSSLDTVQLMQIVWVYTVLNVPRYDVLIVGPTDFNSVQAQENTFRITLKSDIELTKKELVMDRVIWIAVVVFVICAVIWLFKYNQGHPVNFNL